MVVDPQPVHDQASCGNAGMLSIGHVPLTRPGVSWKGLRWMLSRTSPLYIRPTLDREIWSWLWQFHQHCQEPWFARTMTSLCEQGWASMRCIDRFMEESCCPCLFRKVGWMAVCRTESMLHEQAEEAALAQAHGYDCVTLSGGELRATSPCYRPDVAGAVHWRDSAICDPREYMKGLERACRARGVTFAPRTAVGRITRDAGGRAIGVECGDGSRVEATHVVVAAGVWSKRILEEVGVRCPLVGARGYNVRLEGMHSLPAAAAVLSETSIAATPTGNDLRLAGTLEIGPLGKPWIRSRLDQLRRGASAYLEGGLDRAATVEEWAGYRPCLPDGMPAVGGVASIPGLFVGTGHAMLGMTLGPIAGQTLSRLIVGEAAEIDLSLMRPDRFGVSR